MLCRPATQSQSALRASFVPCAQSWPAARTVGAWRTLTICLTFMLSGVGASAQPLPFPASPTTAAAAAAQFDTRAAAVIAMNACSREDDYLRIRTEMAGGNFDSQGEDLTHILVGKLAFLRSQRLSVNSRPCSGQIFRHRARNPDGSFVHATLAAFAAADRLVRAGGPTACARETQEIRQPGQTDGAGNVTVPEGIVVLLTVAPDCLSRQIDEAVAAMRKTTQLGSSKLVCLSTLTTSSKGEFDVNVRELVRILNLANPVGQRAGGILSPSTVDHMYEHLLAARGPLSDPTYSVLIGCDEPAGDALGSPEDTADRHAWYRDLADFLGDAFEWAVITYITYGLVPGGGALVAAPFLLSAAAGESPSEILQSHWDIRVPESENHRLMIETSRFLTNADIIARLEAESYEGVDQVINDQGGVRDWLMRRLQDIAAHDFIEYNARPYSRYSLNAVLNLHDFAARHKDPDLALAARIVLDLSAAKFAATANRGRRIVPFRRLADGDGDGGWYLHETFSGADHEVARSMLLSGQIQTLDTNRERELTISAVAEMVNGATSNYRLPAPVLANAVERRTFAQTVRHAGVERVFQAPAYTISAGGHSTDATGSVLGFDKAADHGVAMPTVIIPTLAGSYLRDLFRFDGSGVHDARTPNACVEAGFACGINPVLPELYRPCMRTEALPGDDMVFVSSAVCFPASPGPHFYLAARLIDCRGGFGCPAGTRWGVMDIAEAPPPPAVGPGKPPADRDPPYLQFQAARRAALRAIALNARNEADYVSSAGRRLRFGLSVPIASPLSLGPTVLSVDGIAVPAATTTGGALLNDGRGVAKLFGTGGPIVIDFSDPFAPKRTP